MIDKSETKYYYVENVYDSNNHSPKKLKILGELVTNMVTEFRHSE